MVNVKQTLTAPTLICTSRILLGPPKHLLMLNGSGEHQVNTAARRLARQNRTVSISDTRNSRSILAGVSLAIGMLSVPFALTAHSVVELVENTEYVSDSLEPLIDESVVQDQLVDSALTPLTQVFTSDAVINLLVEGSGLPGPLPEPLDDAAQALIQPLVDSLTAQIRRTASTIVASPAFAESWRTAVGDSHRSFQDALQAGGDVVIELPVTPFIELVRDDLANQGFGGLERLPVPELSVVLFAIEPPDPLRVAYSIASAFDPWLALVAIGLTGAGVWFAASRQVAWVVVGLTIPVLTIVPLLALQVWLGSQAQSFPVTVAVALAQRPIDVAWTISIVVVLVAATGWFVERRRAQPIA